MFLSLALSFLPLQEAKPLEAVDRPIRAAPLQGPIRHAGTYHVASRVWTRGPDSDASLGPKVLYNNSALTDQVQGWEGWDMADAIAWTDEGRIPSTSGHSNSSADNYLVNGFTFGYCTSDSAGGLSRATIDFYSSYATCTDPLSLTPTASIQVDVPGASSSTACWLVTVDLQGSSLEFQIAGDGDGVFDGTTALDNFGWTLTVDSPNDTAYTAPLLAGDPNNAPYGDGTYYQDGGVSGGTGLATSDMFWLNDQTGTLANGCQSFGGYHDGNPFSSFYLKLYGDSTELPEVDRGIVSLRTLLPHGFAVEGVQEYTILPELSVSSSGAGNFNASIDILLKLGDGPWEFGDTVPIEAFPDGFCEDGSGECSWAHCGVSYITDTGREVDMKCFFPVGSNCGCGAVFCDEIIDMTYDPMLAGELYYLLLKPGDGSATDSDSSNDVLTIRVPGENYCTSTLNSTSLPARIGVVGSASLSYNDFTLIAGPIPQGGGSSMGQVGGGASGPPPRSVAAFVVGDQQTNVPFGNGVLCVQRDRVLLAPVVDGEIRKDLDLSSHFFGQWFQPGTTWNFQAIFQDPQAGGVNSSDGYTVTWQP